MRHIGIDLHSNSFTACYLEEGKPEQIRTFKLQGDEFEVFLSLHSDDEIALEATGNSLFFRDKVLPLAKRIVIISPNSISSKVP